MAHTRILADPGTLVTEGSAFGTALWLCEENEANNLIAIPEEEYTTFACDFCDKVEDSKITAEFWRGFQQEGKRKDYSYAFANWDAKEIKPYYPLYGIKDTIYMFMSCINLEDASNVVVRISGDSPSLMYGCANCMQMQHGPEFIFLDAPIVKTYTSLYANCQQLQDAKIYWGDGSVDPVAHRNACQNLFFRCGELVDVDFGDENTGSPFKLDLSYCTKLSAASYRSLVESLQTIPANSEGDYSITISPRGLEIIEQYDTQQVSADSEFVTTFSMLSTKGWSFVEVDRTPESDNEEE